MARKVEWSHEADADLASIADYISRDSAFYAATFVQEVRDASRFLSEYAERGRVVPEIGNGNVRELFIKEYRLIYEVEKSRVVIYGLIHGKRDLKGLLM